MKLRDEDLPPKKQPKPGTHVANLLHIIDLGTQGGDGSYDPRRTLKFTFELSAHLMEDEKKRPFVISAKVGWSYGKKSALPKILTNWVGRSYSDPDMWRRELDLEDLFKIPVLLTLSENEKGRVVITGYTSVPQGLPTPERVNQTKVLSLVEGEFNREIYNSLPDFDREDIQKSPEGRRCLGFSDKPQSFEDMGTDITSHPDATGEDIPF